MNTPKDSTGGYCPPPPGSVTDGQLLMVAAHLRHDATTDIADAYENGANAYLIAAKIIEDFVTSNKPTEL
jgi:hypothetical protein